MGRIFLDHIGGDRLYACAACDTNLTNRDELISTRFTGATGRAFLFNKVVNLNYRYGVTTVWVTVWSNIIFNHNIIISFYVKVANKLNNIQRKISAKTLVNNYLNNL